MSLVPNVPGETDWGRAVLNRLRSWWDEREPARINYTNLEVIAGHQIGVGFRRFIASDRLVTGHPLATYLHCEMHTDGSAFAATATWTEFNKGKPNELQGFPN